MTSSQIKEEILGNVSMLQIWQLDEMLQEYGDDVMFVAIGELMQEYLDKHIDTIKTPVVCVKKLAGAKEEIDENLSVLQIDLQHTTLLEHGYKNTFACIRQINKEHQEKYKE